MIASSAPPVPAAGFSASVGRLGFHVEGYLPSRRGEPTALAGAQTEACSVRIRAIPVSRPHPRLLDPYHPVPMEWRRRGQQLAIDGRSFASDLDLDRIAETEIPLWVVDDDPEAFHPSLSNLLRILLAIGRLVPSTLLLHSSSILVDGKAVLLLGRSGAGKTTSGRLARTAGLEVPSDDLNLLEIPEEGPIRLQGFPFSGEFGRCSWNPAPLHPVGAILRLEKAGQSKLEPLSAASATAALASCAAFMNAEPSLQAELLSLLLRLTSRLPVHTLRFRKDSSFLPLLREALG